MILNRLNLSKDLTTLFSIIKNVENHIGFRKFFQVCVMFFVFSFIYADKAQITEFRFEAASGINYSSMTDFNDQIKNVNQAYQNMGIESKLDELNILIPSDITFSWLFVVDKRDLYGYYLDAGFIPLNYTSAIRYSNNQKAFDLTSNLDFIYLSTGARKYFTAYSNTSRISPYLGGEVGLYMGFGETNLMSYYSDGVQDTTVRTPTTGFTGGLKIEAGCELVGENFTDFIVKGGYRFLMGSGPKVYKDVGVDFSGFYLTLAFLFGAP